MIDFDLVTPQPHPVGRVAEEPVRFALAGSSTSLEWVRLCAQRLQQLCFHRDEAFLRQLAGELWEDIPQFDPVVAAELEHEAWFSDDNLLP